MMALIIVHFLLGLNYVPMHLMINFYCLSYWNYVVWCMCRMAWQQFQQVSTKQN